MDSVSKGSQVFKLKSLLINASDSSSGNDWAALSHTHSLTHKFEEEINTEVIQGGNEEEDIGEGRSDDTVCE